MAWKGSLLVLVQFKNGGQKMAKYVMALDQGTTSSRSIIFNKNGRPIESLNREFEQIYPKPGWVEHRALDIWNSQIETAMSVL